MSPEAMVAILAVAVGTLTGLSYSLFEGLAEQRRQLDALGRRLDGLAADQAAMRTVLRVRSDRPGRTPDAIRNLIVEGHFDQRSN